MKKIYMSVGALLLSATVLMAQGNRVDAATKAMLGPDQYDGSTKGISNNDKAPGDVIWSETFNGGGWPAGWTVGGTTNGGGDMATQSLGWVVSTDSIDATYTDEQPVVSVSGGEHLLYFSEIVTPTFQDHDAWVQTTGIQLAGATSYTVKFDQKFRMCCSSSAQLDIVISNDPTFATGVTTYSARGAVAINAQAGDDLLQQATYVNISDNWGASNDMIYMRFHWSVGASHYYWMIDDIEVIESLDNDLILSDPYYGSLGLPYTRIPEDQLQPIDFVANVLNAGGVDATNMTLDVQVNAGAEFSGSSAAMTLPALVFGGILANSTADSLVATAQWTPSALPLNVPFTIDFTLLSDSVDGNPIDNSFTHPDLEVNDQGLYAVDNFSLTPGNSGGYSNATPPTEDYECGNYYDMVNASTAEYVDIAVGSNTLPGAIMDAVIYDMTSGSFVEIARSNAHIVVAGEPGTVVRLAMPANTSLLAATTYFVAVHGWGGTTFEFFHGISGSSHSGQGTNGAQASLIFYPSMSAPNTGENYFTSRTPMVRLVITPTAVSVDEIANNVDFNVYPNPNTTGIFNINLDAVKADNVNMTVTNSLGQTIIEKTLSTVAGNSTQTLSLVDYSKGIYFLNIDNKTVKLIVE
jgi:hypothetical protein